MIGKIAVILLNLGGPSSIAEVKPFLLNLFLDREIIELPLQPLTARLIATFRAPKVKQRYQQIGGGSPLLRLTKKQAKDLERLLKMQHPRLEVKVYIGMLYTEPFIKPTVEKISKAGFKELIALPLFPHFSRVTSGSCFKKLEKANLELDKPLKIHKISSWANQPAYIQAIATNVRQSFKKFTSDSQKTKIVFTAHSVPEKFILEGDPYVKELSLTIEALKPFLEDRNFYLSYQSRSGPVKWLSPDTAELIRSLAAQGHQQLLLVPISFVSDHIETLYEIDILYKQIALQSGVKEFYRSPSLNDSPLFIRALAELVEPWLSS